MVEPTVWSHLATFAMTFIYLNFSKEQLLPENIGNLIALIQKEWFQKKTERKEIDLESKNCCSITTMFNKMVC